MRKLVSILLLLIVSLTLSTSLLADPGSEFGKNDRDSLGIIVGPKPRPGIHKPSNIYLEAWVSEYAIRFTSCPVPMEVTVKNTVTDDEWRSIVTPAMLSMPFVGAESGPYSMECVTIENQIFVADFDL